MRKEDFAQVLGGINEKHIAAAKTNHRAKKTAWVKWGAMVACLCLVIAGVCHNSDILNNTPDIHIDPSIGNEGSADTTLWLSADEVLKSAENDPQYMGVSVPMVIAYQGAIYSCSGEEYRENSQYAHLETEVILRKNYSYPAYQVKDISDSVAFIVNGRLTTYQKLFEVDAMIDGISYKAVYSMGLGIDYSYGEVVHETDDFTVHQAVDTQSGKVLESECVINILPLLKREFPTMFDGDENYGDAWWLAVPHANS